jgi:glycosyltransferase involved in cell wall biosynthesis
MNNTLSLCVICKNEEKSIGTLLESVKGSLFDEIIVVDTGSTDSTLEILKRYNVTIEHFNWVNDFSAARNYSFSKATKDYIMWMDSDDYLKSEDYQKLIKLKNNLHESPVWLLKYEYAHDEYGRSICSFYRERIVKRSLNLLWEQPIHEYIPLIHPYQQVDIEVHHNKKEAHTKRNLSILESIVEKNPNFSRNVYYLGKEYFDSGEFEKGCGLLNRFLEMPDGWSENRYGALIRLAEYKIAMSSLNEAREYLHKAIKEDPLKAKAYYYLGDIALGEKDYHTAVHWYSICCNIKRSEKSLDIVEPKFNTWLPNLQLCLAYNYLGNLKEAAMANERALSFRPEDGRMLANKSIFVECLKEDYPFPKDQNLELYVSLNKPFLNYKGNIAWYVSSDSSFASNRIRMQVINDTLRYLGYKSELFSYSNLSSYDLIVTGKVFSQDHLKEIKAWKENGLTVIADINEDVLEFPIVPEIIKECHHVICCSNELKNKITTQLGLSNVQVIEDAVEYYFGDYND